MQYEINCQKIIRKINITYSSSKNCLNVLYFFTVCYITLENKIDKILKILCNILLHIIYNISTLLCNYVKIWLQTSHHNSAKHWESFLSCYYQNTKQDISTLYVLLLPYTVPSKTVRMFCTFAMFTVYL